MGNERKCRICGVEEKTVDHVVYRCKELRIVGVNEKRLMNENGRSVRWMIEIEEERKKLENERGKDK